MGVRATTALLSAAFALTGCFDGGSLTSPAPPPGTQTLVTWARSTDYEALWVQGADEPWPPLQDGFAWSTDAAMTVYAFPSTPEAMQLPRGVHRAQAGGTRRLPAASWTARLDLSGPTPTWQPDGTPADAPDGFELAPFDWPSCLEQGGCAEIAADDAAPAEICALPCTPTEPRTPTAPTLPMRPGWVEDGRQDPLGRAVRVPALPPPTECAPGTFQALGEASCAAIATCGAGWPTPPPGPGRLVYVDAAAQPGGDGSMGRPFRTLSTARAASGAGDRLLLAAGTYTVTPGPVARGQSWRGVCPDDTVLRAGGEIWSVDGPLDLSGMTVPPMSITDGVVRLTEVAWAAPAQPALQIGATASVAVHRAGLRDIGRDAIGVFGGSLTLSEVVVDGAAGQAVICVDGAVRATDVAVRRLEAPPHTAALVSGEGCSLELRRVIGEQGDFHFAVLQGGTHGVFEDIAARNLSGDATTAFVINSGSRAVIRGAYLERAGSSAIALHDGAQALVEDIVTLDTARAPYRGVFAVGHESLLSVERVFMDEPDAQAVVTTDRMDTLQLVDATIDNPMGPRLPIYSVRVEAGTAVFERMYLRGTEGFPLSTTRTEQNFVTLTDVDIEGGLSGVQLEAATVVQATRLRVRNATVHGVVLGGFDAEIERPQQELEHLIIEGTEAGPGLEILNRTRAVVQHFRLLDNGDAGARVFENGRLILRDGRIAGHEIGVQQVDARSERAVDVAQRVRFEDNRVTIQTF